MRIYNFIFDNFDVIIVRASSLQDGCRKFMEYFEGRPVDLNSVAAISFCDDDTKAADYVRRDDPSDSSAFSLYYTELSKAIPEERPYVVLMTIYTGEYEKTTKHVLMARNKDNAAHIALRNECHWDEAKINDRGQMEDAGGEFLYEVYSVTEISKAQYDILKLCGI